LKFCTEPDAGDGDDAPFGFIKVWEKHTIPWTTTSTAIRRLTAFYAYCRNNRPIYNPISTQLIPTMEKVVDYSALAMALSATFSINKNKNTNNVNAAAKCYYLAGLKQGVGAFAMMIESSKIGGPGSKSEAFVKSKSQMIPHIQKCVAARLFVVDRVYMYTPI
jgi:hypothetical protein